MPTAWTLRDPDDAPGGDDAPGPPDEDGAREDPAGDDAAGRAGGRCFDRATPDAAATSTGDHGGGGQDGSQGAAGRRRTGRDRDRPDRPWRPAPRGNGSEENGSEGNGSEGNGSEGKRMARARAARSGAPGRRPSAACSSAANRPAVRVTGRPGPSPARWPGTESTACGQVAAPRGSRPEVTRRGCAYIRVRPWSGPNGGVPHSSSETGARQRVEIGPAVGGAALDLLGREVMKRAADLIRPR